MDRIKKQNAHIQRHAADLEARFAALANDYNKLLQHRNLVLSLGIQCASERRQTRVYCVPTGDSGSRDVATTDLAPRDVAAPASGPRDASTPEHTPVLVQAADDKSTAFTHTLTHSLTPPPPPPPHTHTNFPVFVLLSFDCVWGGGGGVVIANHFCLFFHIEG